MCFSLLRSRLWVLALVLVGCTPAAYRDRADDAAYSIIENVRDETLGRSEPFTIERPSDTLRRRLMLEQQLPTADPMSLGAEEVEPIPQWPDAEYLSTSAPTVPDVGEFGPQSPTLGHPITLLEALEIGARNSREYQTQKEALFRTALALDLERDVFRWTGGLGGDGLLSRDLGADPAVSGVVSGGGGNVSRTLQNGTLFAMSVGVDLVKLLTQERSRSIGTFGDATISIPLLRGAGRFINGENLRQAQRDVVYAIYDFERFKRQFAVQVATDYLGVLRQIDQVTNAEENYRGLISSTRRARRLADAGRLPEIQVDQSKQDELRARSRWISAQQNYQRTFDRFKVLLGLPTDAELALDRTELTKLANVLVLVEPEEEENAAPAANTDEVVLEPPRRDDAGRFELESEIALRLALETRLDLRIAVAEVQDAQRRVAIAADALRTEITLLGSASEGSGRSLASADLGDSGIRPENGFYSALLTIDLPIERTAERNAYRNALISFEAAVRQVQQLEDQIKLDIRDRLRTLLEARESLRIQQQAVKIAERRVESTNLFLQAGRAAIRDLLEAQEALVSAQNALTSARVQYRVSELQLQRDFDLLEVDERGLWREFDPTIASAQLSPEGEPSTGSGAESAGVATPNSSTPISSTPNASTTSESTTSEGPPKAGDE